MAAEPHFASVDPAHDDPFDSAAEPLSARFCVFHAARGAPRGLVLHVHAFGEEMNKSRRMAAMQSRALAEAGFAVLQFDLLGCGDSEGDHGDATWARWLADVQWAAGHLTRHTGKPAPLVLWGQRTGALLAVGAAGRIAADTGSTPHLLFWQPVTQGSLALQQFLRLKAAAEMLDGGGKGIVEGLKRELSAGRPVEVAGYLLHPELASGLMQATLAPPSPAARMGWLEMATPRPDGSASELMPASVAALARWRAAGWQVRAAGVPGPSFWQTTEIEDAPDLLSETLLAVEALVETST